VASAFRRKKTAAAAIFRLKAEATCATVERKETSVAKAVATRLVDLESIDRLEEKIKLLVGLVERLRASEGRLSDENARLVRELDTALARLTASEGSGAEITALREERELIKSRVEDMLAQIESLNL
jgi:regulator of replication initiation timing